MQRSYAVLLLAFFVLTSCAPSHDVVIPSEAPRETIVAAYHPWWMRDTWRKLDADLYDEVFFFAVEMDSTARMVERNGWPDRWFAMQQELTRSGVRVTPVVTLFSRLAFEKLFAGPESSAELRQSLISLLRESPAAGGLQLDFEIYQTVPGSARSNFTRFVSDLRSAMTALRPDLRLSLYVTAYDEGDVYDESALARIADYLVVQGYDLHGRTEARTGPVAALDGYGTKNWRYVVDRIRGEGVPPEKIVMSVPYFGYQWLAESDVPGARTKGRGISITYADVDTLLLPDARTSAVGMAARHGLRRDPASGSPYYAFEDSAGWHQGWFEDAESLGKKYAYVREEGLGGVAIFPAVYGDEELEAVLRRYFGR